MNNTIKLTKKHTCTEYTFFIYLNKADTLNPLMMEVKYDTVNKIPKNDSNFCESCFLIDNKVTKSPVKEIKIHTECLEKVCKPDLAVVGVMENINASFILGSQKAIKVNYEIFNFAEPAYGTKLVIELDTDSVQFSKLPSICSHGSNKMTEMICDMGFGKPIRKHGKIDVDVILDVSQLAGKLLKIKAEVMSLGKDENLENNQYVNEIQLNELSDIFVKG